MFLSFSFHTLDGIWIDSYFRLGASAPKYEGLRVIAFDSATVSGGDSTIPTQALVTFLERIGAEKPAAIGILAELNELHYTPSDLSKIASAVDKTVPVFVGFTEEMSLDKPPPNAFADRFVYAPGLVSRDSFNYGADAVSRRVMTQIDHVPTFYARLASFLRAAPAENVEALGTSRHAYIHWQGPPGTYTVESAWPLLGPVPKPAGVAGQLVLVGLLRRTRPTQDTILTPYSRKIGDTTMLEGAAHGLVTLIRDNGLRRLPAWAVGLVTLVAGVLTVNVAASLAPLRGVAFMAGFLAILWGAGWCALKWAGVWCDLVHPAVMAVASYYLVVPFRLGLEYRKRWQLQRKNEIMSELEMLKANFLSLVSHDLKTPIARIQGKAELLLGDASLAPRTRKGLAAIVATTSQMGEYVETILDLNRIESGKLQMHQQSRDLNVTVREVLEEKRAQAAEKRITLESALDPLFAVKYDVRLLKRVLGNLLENAIKYSPENSTISVSSKDEGERVTVSVSDCGPGIAADEKDKVFGKFYRASGAVESGVQGTGLGLYLVKYFVELHKGEVFVESELGRGSTFSVSLPV